MIFSRSGHMQFPDLWHFLGIPQLAELTTLLTLILSLHPTIFKKIIYRLFLTIEDAAALPFHSSLLLFEIGHL